MASSVIWGSSTMSSTPLCFTLWLCQWKRSLLPWGGGWPGGSKLLWGGVGLVPQQPPPQPGSPPSLPSESASPQPPASLLLRHGDTRRGGCAGVWAPCPRGGGSVLPTLHLLSHCHAGDRDARPKGTECAWGSGGCGRGEGGRGEASLGVDSPFFSLLFRTLRPPLLQPPLPARAPAASLISPWHLTCHPPFHPLVVSFLLLSSSLRVTHPSLSWL